MQVFTKNKSTKEAIIQILSSEWPLSLNKIHNKLKKKHSIGLTYQATHKSINELVEEKILHKEKKEYKLNIEWINNVEQFGKKLRESYIKKDQIPNIEVGSGSSVEKEGFEAGKEAAEKAVSEIKYYDKPNLALVFISSEYEGHFEGILSGIHSVIGDTQLIGCTGAGEVKDKRLKGSVVITLIASKNFEVDTTIIEDVGDYSNNYGKAAQYLIKENKITMPNFGIIFIPGLCESNEIISSAPFIIESLKKLLQKDFPMIGAQAGDDWKFKITYQFHNQKVYSNAVILTLVKTNLKFGINGKPGYMSINNKTYRIKVKDNCITKIANNNGNKLKYEPAVSFYEKEIGISHKKFKQTLPIFIKENISQNILGPIGDIDEPTHTSHPVKIIKQGIRFEYNYSDNAIIQIRGTTNSLLVQTVNNVVNETIKSNNIKNPKLILIFPCCIFEAILSKSDISEIEALKKQTILNSCGIVGTYVYGEVGTFGGEIKSASGTVVCLVVGEDKTE